MEEVYDIRRRIASIVRVSASGADPVVMAISPAENLWRRPQTAVYPDSHYIARWRENEFPAGLWERPLCLNLDGVFLGVSALEELILPLAREVRNGSFGSVALMVATSDDRMADVLEALATRHELPFFITRSAADPFACARPVGLLTTSETDTLGLLLGLGGEITTSAFASASGMKVSAAGNRLTTLARKGYVHRRRRSGRDGDVYVDPRVAASQAAEPPQPSPAAGPLEVPENLSAAVQAFAAQQGEQPASLLAQAWSEFTDRHADALSAASAEAATLMQAGDRDGLAALANRHVDQRASSAAARAVKKD